MGLHAPPVPVSTLSPPCHHAPPNPQPPTVQAEDYGRYEKQYGYIQRICALYEANPSDFAQLIELLQAVRGRAVGGGRA